MQTKFLTAHVSPKEVEKFVETLVYPEGGIYNQPINKRGKNFSLTSDLRVDFRDAKAKYRLGSLQYGPVDVSYLVKDLTFKVDWHNDLNIPHDICIELKDPCGDTILKECLHFDLGITDVVVIQNGTLRWRDDSSVLYIAFRDKGGEYYALTGDVPICEMLYRLIAGFIRGAIAQAGDLVEKLLESCIGTGDIAKLFIAAIKLIFKILDKLLGFLEDIITLIIFRPIDELLHQIFGDNLEITLQSEGFPKKLKIIPEAKPLPPVIVGISTPPKITLVQTGLELEVYQ